MHRTIFLCALLTFSCSVISQTPISNVVTNYQPANTGLSYALNAEIYNYGNLSGSFSNNQAVDGIILPDGSYLYNVFINGAVKLRRVNNATSYGRKSLVWMESSEIAGVYNIFPPYTDSMEVFFNGRTINKGTDNLFGNRDDDLGNNNNIERVDWVITSGVVTSKPSESGFPVFERGADDVHDPFCIAAILALDANGNPVQYGQVLRVGSGNFGNLPNSSLNYSILRKEQTEPELYRTGTGNQKRGGVFISFRDLGVDSGQVIYGYSLFAHDLPLSANSSNLIDYTNTTYFPTTTSSNTSEGGIDLIAFAGLFHTTGTDVVLPVKYFNWKANVKSGKAFLNWDLDNASGCKKIEVQKSYDGQRWQTIASLQPFERQFTDENIKGSIIYYRLKLYDAKVFTYTTIKRIKNKVGGLSDFTIRKENSIILEYNMTSATSVTFQLLDQAGGVVVNHSYKSIVGSNKVLLDYPKSRGVYIIRLYANGDSFSKQVVF